MSTTSTATAQTATKSEQLRVLSNNNASQHHDTNEPLPSDLKLILTEVAQYGGSSWLSWSTEQQHPLHNNLNNSLYRFHIKRTPPKRRHTSTTNNSTNTSSSSTKRLRQNNNSSTSSPSIVIPLLSGASDSNCSYECDSEGTSSVSEMSSSGDHRRHNHAMRYKTLAKAVSAGIAFVLDHSYRTHGGYKPTSAEICQFQNSQMKQQAQQQSAAAAVTSPESVIFQQRKQRLVQSVLLRKEGPPFTIQRLAEVMVDPFRFYKQTHKLCNCLEKLLLVSSSIHAFGGSTGGTTSQSRQEERELAALADERERQEKTEQENLRQRRRVQSEISSDLQHSSVSNKQQHNEIANQKKIHDIQVQQAKVGLRNKFEPSSGDSDNKLSPTNSPTNSPRKKRSLTSSPPPPSFGQHNNDLQHRAPSPILFARDGARLSPERNPHLIQMHHQQQHHPHNNNNAMVAEELPLDVVRIHKNSSNNNSISVGGTNYGSTTKESSPNSGASKDMLDADTEIDPGRSSASNSDVDDSETDVSLDDSASDGSTDCGEQPFSAARLRALNRKQQQQRLQQSRVQMLVGEQGLLAAGRNINMEAAEYQSGDSIDSTMAEDSGGSDSSSSDLAD